MEKLAVATHTEPLGKSSFYTFDPETGEEVLAGELKRRQAERAASKNKNTMANNGPPPENAAHPEEFVADTTLPSGWKKVRLVKNPKVQWYVSNSGEEQWFRPGNLNSTTVMLEDEAGLEPGWQRAYNSRNTSTPKAIWYEHEDGRTQWERPGTNNSKNTKTKNNASSALAPTSSGNALGNLKAQINKLGNTLNNMQTTLTKTHGGRRKRRTTRRRKTRRRSSNK